MTTRTHPDPLVLRVWSSAVWPLLMSIVCLVGLSAAWQAVGPAAVLSISITVSLFAMSMAWGMAPGSVSKARWLACGAGAPLALLVVLGWCQLMGALGLAAPALAAVTSPACVSFVHELRRTANERRLARLRRWERMILDKELADRRFAQIVARLERSEKSLDS